MGGPTTARSTDPVPWLLEGDAAVRYATLTELLGTSPDDPEAVATRRTIMTDGVVPQILAEQLDDGHWEGRDRFYRGAYRGTVWTLIILAELGADGSDPRIRAGCEAVLRDSQDPQSGGFAMDRAKKTGGGRRSTVVPCLTGNMVWSLIRFGMLDDPRVQHGIDWITTYQRFDDGDGDAPTGWPYDHAEPCFGRHTCHMGVVKALKALAAIPVDRRSPDVVRTIDGGVDFMLKHHIHKRSHDVSRVAKPGWLRLGFPLMYQTDIGEVLLVLTRLGVRDDRMTEALDALRRRADGTGRWRLESTHNDRLVAPVETQGEPSRWVTLRALQVLRASG